MEPRYIGILVYWYIGILVYWYGILVYWNTRILDKHYLFLRFLDPSQVTIADWMPFAYMHTWIHVDADISV